jgi:hypothetical protein
MANEDTVPPLRQDETQQTNGQLLVPYPQVFTTGDDTVYYVNTGANYRYLSQLIVTFDENGKIVEIGEESGTFATDVAGVDRLYEADITTIADVKAVADPEVVAIIEGVQGYVNQLDGQVFGQTDVFLNGIRGSVRTQETNLGNLAADAQDFYAEEYLEAYGDSLLAGFDEIDISFKNGGGIRDQIGLSFIAGGGGELVQLPPPANPEVGKEEGDVSALDILNSLRFDNALSVGKVTASGLYELFEHAVARVEAVGGQFAQVSGVRFSFDPTAPARTMTQAGERVQNLVVLNEDGTIKDIVVQDGELVGDPNRQFSVVTLAFLATGGDGYPLVLEELKSLSDFDEPNTLGRAELEAGGEQDALAEYLSAFFNGDNGQAPFAEADTDQSGDTRIQNLAFREDTVLEDGTDENSGLGGQVEFAVAAGATLTVTDFGGIGQGARPSADAMAEVDTLVFTGDGLTAENLQLTQNGADLEITFLGDEAGTKVVLSNFQLDQLDNLLVQTGGNIDRGNIIFANETAFSDSFDVFNADSTRSRIWNPNSVTFLNDLDNTVAGFDSDDVINALGGNDVIQGFGGNDILRGGSGDDLLDGGLGDDTYTGDEGADTFVFASGQGIDTITDFEVDVDQIALGTGLTADKVRLFEVGSDTLVLTQFNELLGVIQGVTGLTTSIFA